MSEPEQIASSPGRVRQALSRFRSRARTPLLFLAGVAAAFIALAAYNTITPDAPRLTQRDVNKTVAEAMASATPPPPYGIGVHQAIMPSLILVQTDVEGALDTGADEKGGHSLGSGVVINDQGDILTSLHVVDDATTIHVTFADGTESIAYVVSSQPENDIAVLRAETPPSTLVPAVIGNAGAMQVGDEAYVVGNPLGLYGTLTTGTISGLKRSFKPTNSETELSDLIQFDAAVNPGSSGGPLLNRYGQVVGIVAALVNPAGQDAFAGIGFAVPITAAGGGAGLPPY